MEMRSPDEFMCQNSSLQVTFQWPSVDFAGCISQRGVHVRRMAHLKCDQMHEKFEFDKVRCSSHGTTLWYSVDFGKNDTEKLRFISKFLQCKGPQPMKTFQSLGSRWSGQRLDGEKDAFASQHSGLVACQTGFLWNPSLKAARGGGHLCFKHAKKAVWGPQITFPGNELGDFLKAQYVRWICKAGPGGYAGQWQEDQGVIQAL
eukprot:1142328-Pelagomonas_calceolata.AAC.3